MAFDRRTEEELILSFAARHPNASLRKLAEGTRLPRWRVLQVTRDLDLDGRLIVTGGGRKALVFRLPTVLDR